MQVTTYIKNNITPEQIKNYLEISGARNITVNHNQIRCTCPIHQGDNPTAFAYDLEKHLWVCFTGNCGGGDIFDLAEKLSNYHFDTFSDLISYTATIFGINISGMNLDIRRELIQQENKRWLQYMSRRSHKNAVYDLSNIGELKHVEVGYRGFSEATLSVFEARYSTLYNRIVIPLKNENSDIVGITMRRCDESEKIKWLHVPREINTGEILFNYDIVRLLQTDSVILVEGVFDVMQLTQLGISNSVSCLGAHLTEAQESMVLKRFTDVMLAYDNDKAGITCTNKVIDRLKDKTNLTVLELGNIHDPGDIKSKEEFDSLKQLKWYEWRKLHGF